MHRPTVGSWGGGVSYERGIPVRTTSPQIGSKWSFFIALVCTKGRRIPAGASSNQVPEKGELIPLWGLVEGHANRETLRRTERLVIPFVSRLPLERCPPRQKSRVERLKATVEPLLT